MLGLLVAPLVLSEFSITLLNYIGLASLVVLGLVLLTGVSGLTSFGQAAFVGAGRVYDSGADDIDRAAGQLGVAWRDRRGSRCSRDCC